MREQAEEVRLLRGLFARYRHFFMAWLPVRVGIISHEGG
jgi:hypothetical protein